MSQTKYLIQRFIGGMNSDMPSAAIDLTKQDDAVVDVVANVENGVFERGLLRARPQLVVPATTSNLPSTNTILAVAKLPFPANKIPTGLAVPIFNIGGMCLTLDSATSLYRLWKLNAESAVGNPFDVTEITGPGITAAGWDNFIFSNCVVNGVVLIGGYKGGLIRWDPYTLVYTVIANAKWAYVAKQNSRALGAYLTTGLINDSFTFGASKTGDETTWVATSIEAYQNTVADIGDVITGIGVVKGIVVLPRTFGFHLAYPTGTFPAIYNVVQHSEDAIGCAHPGTFCIYKNICYFCSTSGVHTFDLVDIEQIGEGVLTEILSTLAARGGTLRGFISSSYKLDDQPTYNLFIDFVEAGGMEGVGSFPLWSYNIKERKWTRWFANSPGDPAYSHYWHAFYYRGLSASSNFNPLASTVAKVFRKSGTVSRWSYTKELYGSSSEQFVTSFTTGQLTISAPVFEATITRIMLVYTCNCDFAPNFSIFVDSTLNGITTTTPQIATGVASPTGSAPTTWVRQWIGNMRCVGQMFEVQVVVPALQNVLVKEMIIEFTDTSKERA